MDSYLPLFRAKTRASHTNISVDAFSFIDKTPFEKVHLSFCKYLLGVKKSSSNLAVRLELDRLPVEKYIKVQSVLFFARLHTENINPLLKESFNLAKELDTRSVYSWYTYIKNVVSEGTINVTKLSNCKTLKEVKLLKPEVKARFSNFYNRLFESRIENLTEHNKLFIYKHIKTNMCTREFYLNNSNIEYRQYITKFRISSHNLEVELGRYKKVPRNLRICNFCKLNETDDEYHFFFRCELNLNLRNEFLSELDTDITEFQNLCENDKLKIILNPTNLRQVLGLGSFLKRSTELRTRDSCNDCR